MKIILNHGLICVHTIPHMNLGNQNKRDLWCGKEGGTAALTRGSGKIERRPNSPSLYFEAVSLVVFLSILIYFKRRCQMKTKILNVLLGLLVLGTPLLSKDNSVQDKLMARRAAIADAQRNLVEKIYGIQIDAGTRVEDFITRNDQIRGKLDGFIAGAEIVDYGLDSDGIYKVEIEIDLERLIKLIGKKFKYETRFIKAEGKGTFKDSSPKRKKKRDTEMLRAIGRGTKPKDEDISKEQKILMAERAAMLDAYRNIIERIKGVEVDGETTVQDFITQDDTIMTRIQDFVRGAKVVSSQTKKDNDNIYEVEIEIDLEELKKIIKKFGG